MMGGGQLTGFAAVKLGGFAEPELFLALRILPADDGRAVKQNLGGFAGRERELQVAALAPLCLKLPRKLSRTLTRSLPMVTDPAADWPEVAGRRRPGLFVRSTMVAMGWGGAVVGWN